jgi:hypothetical protein
MLVMTFFGNLVALVVARCILHRCDQLAPC